MSRALEERVRALEARLAGSRRSRRSRGSRPATGRSSTRATVDRARGLARSSSRSPGRSRSFTEDAVWDGGAGLGVCRGRAELRERFLEQTLRFSWHYFVKPRIEVAGDRARGTWDLLAPCTTRDGVATWMAGVEDDEYARVDGVWLHSAMRLRVVFLAPHERGWARPG